MQIQAEKAPSSIPSVHGTTSRVQDGLNLRWLDSLRGIAILLVILVHAGETITLFMPHGTPEYAWSLFGMRGVQLFYMLSAFTLLFSLDHARSEYSPLRNFYLRRLFRIAPLFYVAIALNALQLHILRLARVPWTHLLLGIFFLNGANPAAINTVTPGGWSIAVEMTFYLMLPFLYPRLRTTGRCVLAAAVTAGIFWQLSMYLNHLHPEKVWADYLTTFWFPVEFPVFLLGMGVYAFWKTVLQPWKAGATPDRQRRVSALLLVATPLPLLIPGIPQLYTASVAGALLILAASLWSWRAIENRLTVRMGRVSYSIYLLHFFVIFFFSVIVLHLPARLRGPLFSYASAHPQIAVMLIMIFITAWSIPVAIMSARLIERPGMALGRRLIERLERADSLRSSTQIPPSASPGQNERNWGSERQNLPRRRA